MLKISEFDDVIHHIENKGYNSAILLLKAMKHNAEEELKSSNKKDAITAFEAWVSIYEENYPERNDFALTCREREMWLFGYNTAKQA